MTIIKTKRLALREFRKIDFESLTKQANDKTIAKNTFIPYPYTVNEAKKWINKNLAWYKRRNKTEYALVIEIDGEFAGCAGIHKIIAGHKAELGYWLGREYWGKGYMTEAVKEISNLAFKKFKLKRLYAYTFLWNESSRKVLEKAGFKYEGILKKNSKKKNQCLDDYVFAKIK